MSGRKGLGVKADDLIDRLEAEALAEVAGAASGLSVAETNDARLPHQIAVGAPALFPAQVHSQLSHRRLTFKEALSFEGETGPVLSVCGRARQLDLSESSSEAADGSGWDLISTLTADIRCDARRYPRILTGESGTDIWSLFILAPRLAEANAQAATTAEPAILAKYAFNLAKGFNLFYHRHRIIAEEDQAKRAVLIVEISWPQYTRPTILGIAVPERM